MRTGCEIHNGERERPGDARPGAEPQPAPPRGVARLLIVEDHEMLAQTLAIALAPRYNCTIATLDGEEMVVGQASRLRPALVVLDLGLGAVDGLDLISGLLSTGARVLVVTGSPDESRLGAALALGASGWVSKSQPFERLIDAVESVMRRRPLLSEAERNRLMRLGSDYITTERELRRRVGDLTPRELEVLRALSEGETADQIARNLSISTATTRSHIQAIREKLGVSSQLAAAAAARSLPAGHDAVGPPRHAA